MKTLLTALLFIVFNRAMAQSKEVELNAITWTVAKDMSQYIKHDTVSVWFKEVIIGDGIYDTLSTNGFHNLNNQAKEYWQHGYCVYTYSTSQNIAFGGDSGKNMLQESCHDSTIPGVFLYSDRKTLVKNPIIAVIVR